MDYPVPHRLLCQSCAISDFSNPCRHIPGRTPHAGPGFALIPPNFLQCRSCTTGTDLTALGQHLHNKEHEAGRIHGLLQCCCIATIVTSWNPHSVQVQINQQSQRYSISTSLSIFQFQLKLQVAPPATADFVLALLPFFIFQWNVLVCMHAVH